MSPTTWTVPLSANGDRLDVFLAACYPNETRSHIAKLLKQGAGTVNGQTASVHHFIRTGDVIIFDLEPASTDSEVTEKPKTLPFTVIDETPDYLVINKPAGLLMHPDQRTTSDTLIDAVIKKYPDVARVGEDPSRPGVMHRLDRDASGLVVIARTQLGFEELKKQFATHQVDKKYLALVYGTVVPDEGELRFRIARSKNRPRMAARPVADTEGKAAWTHFRTVDRHRTASLLELDILSGRTHQIRSHLLAFTHPIVGDSLYKPRHKKIIPAPRLMLQNILLRFNDPRTQERKTYTIPPEPVFAHLFSTLT